MKRKVIQLGENTHVITLPTKWLRQFGIQKGSELDLTEAGNKLTVSTGGPRAISHAAADIRSANERTTRWILSSLHKQGYDEIELSYDSPAQAKLIEELLKDLFLGFAIVHKAEHTMTLRAVTAELDNQLDTILRRAFLVTLQHAEGLHNLLSKKESPAPLLSLEKQNNQLTNFCQRILCKKGHPNPLKTNFLYTITWNLEKISDEYKYLTEHFMNTPPVAKTLALLDETNQLLRAYYELYYQFSAKKLSDLSEQYNSLAERIKQELPSDPLALAHLLSIVLKTADFSASTYALHA